MGYSVHLCSVNHSYCVPASCRSTDWKLLMWSSNSRKGSVCIKCNTASEWLRAISKQWNNADRGEYKQEPRRETKLQTTERQLGGNKNNESWMQTDFLKTELSVQTHSNSAEDTAIVRTLSQTGQFATLLSRRDWCCTVRPKRSGPCPLRKPVTLLANKLFLCEWVMSKGPVFLLICFWCSFLSWFRLWSAPRHDCVVGLCGFPRLSSLYRANTELWVTLLFV